MAAETQVPSGTFPGKGFFTQLLNDINTAVSLGCFATTDLVSAAITNVTNEQGKH